MNTGASDSITHSMILAKMTTKAAKATKSPTATQTRAP